MYVSWRCFLPLLQHNTSLITNNGHFYYSTQKVCIHKKYTKQTKQVPKTMKSYLINQTREKKLNYIHHKLLVQFSFDIPIYQANAYILIATQDKKHSPEPYKFICTSVKHRNNHCIFYKLLTVSWLHIPPVVVHIWQLQCYHDSYGAFSC